MHSRASFGNLVWVLGPPQGDRQRSALVAEVLCQHGSLSGRSLPVCRLLAYTVWKSGWTSLTSSLVAVRVLQAVVLFAWPRGHASVSCTDGGLLAVPLQMNLNLPSLGSSWVSAEAESTPAELGARPR